MRIVLTIVFAAMLAAIAVAGVVLAPAEAGVTSRSDIGVLSTPEACQLTKHGLVEPVARL
jgi:hypothetical protein